MPAIKTIYEGESLADVAVNVYGNIEALFAIAEANGLTADATPAAGALLQMPEVTLPKQSISFKAANVFKNIWVKALPDQSLVDLAIQEGGTVEALFDLAKLNGLNITDEPVAGIEYMNVPKQPISIKPAGVFKNIWVKALPHQVLVDLAIQEGGTVEALFDVAQRNALNITDDITPGNEYAKPAVMVAPIVKMFSVKNKPASGIPIPEKLEGIDYWYLENDFIVQ